MLYCSEGIENLHSMDGDKVENFVYGKISHTLEDSKKQQLFRFSYMQKIIFPSFASQRKMRIGISIHLWFKVRRKLTNEINPP